MEKMHIIFCFFYITDYSVNILSKKYVDNLLFVLLHWPGGYNITQQISGYNVHHKYANGGILYIFIYTAIEPIIISTKFVFYRF